MRAREAREKPFGDRVARAVEEKKSQLVVGLDPRIGLLPVELRADRSSASPAAAAARIASPAPPPYPSPLGTSAGERKA